MKKKADFWLSISQNLAVSIAAATSVETIPPFVDVGVNAIDLSWDYRAGLFHCQGQLPKEMAIVI
ncbi:MAG TPA: hypothetical protein IGS17_08520 [Oscillatoriales cyanobacterium M59_W2019_021]|nr:hypothetical protein [Oscillatoriales cyanobacterium M59_W2019_021]